MKQLLAWVAVIFALFGLIRALDNALNTR